MSRFLTKVMLWNHTKMPFLHEAIWSPSGRRHLNTSIVWRNSIVFLIHLLGNHSQVKLGWTMYTFSNKIWNRILFFWKFGSRKTKITFMCSQEQNSSIQNYFLRSLAKPKSDEAILGSFLFPFWCKSLFFVHSMSNNPPLGTAGLDLKSRLLNKKRYQAMVAK